MPLKYVAPKWPIGSQDKPYATYGNQRASADGGISREYGMITSPPPRADKIFPENIEQPPPPHLRTLSKIVPLPPPPPPHTHSAR